MSSSEGKIARSRCADERSAVAVVVETTFAQTAVVKPPETDTTRSYYELYPELKKAMPMSVTS